MFRKVVLSLLLSLTCVLPAQADTILSRMVELPDKFQVLQLGEVHKANKDGLHWVIVCFLGSPNKCEWMVIQNIESGLCTITKMDVFALNHTYVENMNAD
jgi:hypothetical protein